MEDDIKIKSQDIHNYSCPGCGSNMVFDPETSSLSCPYCGGKQAIDSENLHIKEYDYDAAEQSLPIDWGNQKKIITCKNCGSEVILDAVETANSCAFCGSFRPRCR